VIKLRIGEDMEWYKKEVGYQIYPRSFFDSNGDGIGDLVGITKKLKYLKSLGVGIIWLGPIYKSPMDDNGYDVADFYNIDEDYGTIKDLRNLVDKAHKMNIRVVMDLILNHTSDEHPWFIESRKSKDNKYREYYIWQKGRIVDNMEVEPTNWASFFHGSAWKKDKLTGEYYMKIFSDKMPDLNWKSEALRKDMHKMIKFWCDFGIDGFRVDAVAHLDRDEFTDSVGEGKYIGDWKRFSNLRKVYDYLEEINEKVLSKYDCFTVGEVGGGASLEDALKYVAYDHNRLNMVFTFDHNWRNDGFNSFRDEFMGEIDLLALKEDFARFQKGLYGKAWHALYWLNHDHPRVMSQYGDVAEHKLSAKMLATLLYFMRGTPFIYNGEEIGMTNGDFESIDDFRDLPTIKNYHQQLKRHPEKHVLTHIKTVSRDNSRTPMQWDKTENAGFSEGTPWIKVNQNYKWLNVKSQLKDFDSIWHYYKKIIKMRKLFIDTVVDGTFEMVDASNDKVFSYIRKGSKRLLIVCNFTNEDFDYDINMPVKHIILGNYRKHKPNKLRKYEAIVLELEDE